MYVCDNCGLENVNKKMIKLEIIRQMASDQKDHSITSYRSYHIILLIFI
jgi:hypothetical protein